ncbi:MAG: hypothetical protein ABIU09_06325 [Pyrinomonadaceae bacterium]
MSDFKPTRIPAGRPANGGWALRLRCLCICALTFLYLGAKASYAQPEEQDIAPPPLRFVSKEDLAQLNIVTDVKKRTKLALLLMSGRLTQAETLHTQEQLDDMFKQLGGFHGLMDNTLAFLEGSDQDSSKVLNNYKRFELGLREYRPRLELIRRDLPLKYEFYVRNLIKYLRDARAKAVEPLFSDTVVPNKKP